MQRKSLHQKANGLFTFNLFLSIFIFSGLFYWIVPSDSTHLIKKLGEAHVKSYLLERYGSYENRLAKFKSDEMEYQGTTYHPNAFLNRGLQSYEYIALKNRIIMAASLSLILISALLFFEYRYIQKKDKRKTDETIIRGVDCIEGMELIKLLQKKKLASHYKIAGIPLVKDSEIQHTLLMGSTGVGKTSAMADFVHQARRDNVSMVIYDFNNYYTKTLYKKGDILLNPFDARMPYWDIWQEAQERPDFDLIAGAQIPLSPSSEVEQWNQFARTLYANTAYGMGMAGKKDTDMLLTKLLQSDISQLEPFIKGTEAETLSHAEFAKFALSVKAVLSSYLKSMQYLPKDGRPFSIRDWVKNSDKKGQCVFITTHARYHASLRPLLTLWLDLFLSAAMGLKPNLNHRLFFLLDEFPTLYKLPNIDTALSTVRKNGIGIVLGAQSHSQIYEHYGEHGAKIIMDNCNTGVYFRCNDSVSAAYCAKQLGDKEVEIILESITTLEGNKKQRSKQNQPQTKPTVLMSEIMRLPDLTAFVKLKGDLPIARSSFQYKAYPAVVDAFIERMLNQKEK